MGPLVFILFSLEKRRRLMVENPRIANMLITLLRKNRGHDNFILSFWTVWKKYSGWMLYKVRS